MAEVIRQGDPTSHGGTAIEGSLFDICIGKPIAFVGHKVTCPKCKSIFSIAEGAPNATFYGNGIALEGMKRAGGDTLIAAQFTDTVDYSRGSAPTAKIAKAADQSQGASTQTSHGAAVTTGTGNQQFNEKFMLIDDETEDSSKGVNKVPTWKVVDTNHH